MALRTGSQLRGPCLLWPLFPLQPHLAPHAARPVPGLGTSSSSLRCPWPCNLHVQLPQRERDQLCPPFKLGQVGGSSWKPSWMPLARLGAPAVLVTLSFSSHSILNSMSPPSASPRGGLL